MQQLVERSRYAKRSPARTSRTILHDDSIAVMEPILHHFVRADQNDHELSVHYARQYDSHLKYLKLKGLQPKTIDARARAIRRLGGYFDYRIETLTEAQLTAYFSDLIGTHS